jgi:hypothetical protein
MRANRCNVRWQRTAVGRFDLGPRTQYLGSIASRILRKWHETDLLQIDSLDDPEALLILVYLARDVEAAKVLGAADRASPDGWSPEARAESLMQGQDAAVRPPEFATIVAIERAAKATLDEPPEFMRFGEAICVSRAIDEERVDEAFDRTPR